jgi:hypothetical protein
MLGGTRDRLGTTLNQPYAQSTYYMCAIIHCVPDNCNRELCLTVPICFREINHMAVKNHLHSSYGVQEVVSGTGGSF